MYVPGDSPLVLHIANLLTVSTVGQQFKMTAQCCHLLVHSESLGLESNTSHMHSTAVCELILCHACLLYSIKKILTSFYDI